MKTLLALAFLTLFQDKPFDPAQGRPEVTLIAGTPQDRWPIAGTAQVPERTLLSVSITRYGRRWDDTSGKFHETLQTESRPLPETVEVKGKAFKASFPKGLPGFHKATISQDSREIHSRRMLLGRTDEVFGALPRHTEKLKEISGRLMRCLEEVEALSRDPRKKPAKAAEEFQKRIAQERKLLGEIASKTDLQATLAVFEEVCQYLLGIDLWERTESQTPEAADDDKEEALAQKIINPGAMKALLESTKKLLAAEVAAGAAGIIEDLFLQAQQDPAKGLSRARDVAREALKALKELPEADKELCETLEAAAQAEAKTMTDVAERLKSAVSSFIIRS